MSTFPKFGLEETMRVAQIIEDTNAGQPLPPVETALALDLSPRNSQFEQITSASIKYGLTTGSSRADVISITALGQRVVSPTSREDKAAALLDAALAPDTFQQMYEYYRGKKLPEPQYLLNTIVREFDVPRPHAESCAKVFTENMDLVGMVKARGKDRYLSTQVQPAVADRDGASEDEEPGLDVGFEPDVGDEESVADVPGITPEVDAPVKKTNNKVFISHGKNTSIVQQLKEVLTFGNLEPVVSVERDTTSKPVPEKVMDDMRSCGAGIIHVGAERKVMDGEGNEHVMLNQNVLIEIGAAMALYDRRFILIVEKGTTLPSNLQGLYEVRLEGDSLDHPATMKLLRTFNEFRAE